MGKHTADPKDKIRWKLLIDGRMHDLVTSVGSVDTKAAKLSNDHPSKEVVVKVYHPDVADGKLVSRWKNGKKL